jgi:hypothetical protein
MTLGSKGTKNAATAMVPFFINSLRLSVILFTFARHLLIPFAWGSREAPVRLMLQKNAPFFAARRRWFGSYPVKGSIPAYPQCTDNLKNQCH